MSLSVTLYKENDVVFDYNITHNLNEMAEKCGMYYAMWRPEEIGIIYARDLIPFLRAGLFLLRSDKYRFVEYEAKNGWGKIDTLIDFTEKYLMACILYPDAEIDVRR